MTVPSPALNLRGREQVREQVMKLLRVTRAGMSRDSARSARALSPFHTARDGFITVW